MLDLDGLTLIHREVNSLVPWQNGAGLTRQIAIFPTDADINNFIWRISVAEIKGDSEYSQFADARRTQMLLSGDGVELSLPHEVCVLNIQYQSIEFIGNDTMSCRTLNGPCQVLNVMVRQGIEKSEIVVIHGTLNKLLDHMPRVFYIAQGEYDVVIPRHKNITLRTGDALLLTANQFKFNSVATSNSVIIEITFY